jgi:hypothetical protein
MQGFLGIKPSEAILIISGFLLLASVFFLFSYENFTLFVTAKIFFAVGALLFLFTPLEADRHKRS